eukprot:SAG22_NODE_5990_length_920_cov_1.112058_2_plen_199_part_01
MSGWLSGIDPNTFAEDPQNPFRTLTAQRSLSTPGRLPEASEGIVDAIACFDAGSNHPCFYHTRISTVNCGGYFLWRLPFAGQGGAATNGAPYCNAGYCTASTLAGRRLQENWTDNIRRSVKTDDEVARSAYRIGDSVLFSEAGRGKQLRANRTTAGQEISHMKTDDEQMLDLVGVLKRLDVLESDRETLRVDMQRQIDA